MATHPERISVLHPVDVDVEGGGKAVVSAGSIRIQYGDRAVIIEDPPPGFTITEKEVPAWVKMAGEIASTIIGGLQKLAPDLGGGECTTTLTTTIDPNGKMTQVYSRTCPQ